MVTRGAVTPQPPFEPSVADVEGVYLLTDTIVALSRINRRTPTNGVQFRHPL